MAEFLVIVRADRTVFDISKIPKGGFKRNSGSDSDSDIRYLESTGFDPVTHAVNLGYPLTFITDDIRWMSPESKIGKKRYNQLALL